MPYDLPPSVLQMLQGGAPQGQPAPALPGLPPVPSYELPPSVMDFIGSPHAATPPIQNSPDYVAGIAQPQQGGGMAIKPPPAPAAAPAPKPTMPTIADTVAQGQQATQSALAANSAATDAAVGRAADTSTAMDQGLERQKELAEQQRQFQEQSDKIRGDKTLALAAANKEVDSYKVDQNKYWNDASTAKKIGWGIAMALSGLGDALQHKSGPNPVIEMLQQTARQSVQAQVDQRGQLEKKASRAGADVDAWDRFSTNRDAQFAARMSQAQILLAQQVQTAAAKYGSQEALANGQKVAAELQKGAAKDAQTAIDLAHGHAMQEGGLRVAQGQLGVASRNQALNEKQFDQHKVEFEWQKNKDQQQLDLEAGKLAQTGNAALAKQTQDKGIAGVTNRDGTPFIAQGGEAEVSKLRDQVTAARTMVGLFDEVSRMRTGGTTSLGNSDEYQRLRTIWAAQKGVAKNLLQLGALSESDYDLMEGFLGSSDPTKFRDPFPGINQARQNVIRMTNEALRGRGLDGNFDIPKLQHATNTDAETATQSILQDKTPSERVDDTKPGVLRKALTEQFPGTGILYKTLGGKTSDELAKEAEESGGIVAPGLSKGQEQTALDLIATAKGKEANAKQAQSALIDLATGKNEAVRGPVLKLLEDQAPDLFRLAVPRLSKPDREFWVNYARIRARGATGGTLP